MTTTVFDQEAASSRWRAAANSMARVEALVSASSSSLRGAIPCCVKLARAVEMKSRPPTAWRGACLRLIAEQRLPPDKLRRTCPDVCRRQAGGPDHRSGYGRGQIFQVRSGLLCALPLFNLSLFGIALIEIATDAAAVSTLGLHN